MLILIAGLEAQSDEIEQALKTVNKALKKRPKVTGFILMKANLLEALGDQEETLKWYNRSSRKNKYNYDIRLAEVKYLIKTHQSELALDKLETIIQTWPDAEEALFIAGLTAIDLKNLIKLNSIWWSYDIPLAIKMKLIFI